MQAGHEESREGNGVRSRGGIATVGILVALFVFGFALNIYYAPQGLMPLDQSVVFDGGWRILSGQVPYRDFTPRTGLFPSVLQAGFFAAFGVSWFVYCLHASVFNGLFCVLVYAFLRLGALHRRWAAFWAALSAVVFYPPSGTPYMENHASFIVFLLVLLLVWLRQTDNDRLAHAVWIALPFGWTLVFLSKQNIAAFAVAPLLLAGLLSLRDACDARVALRSLVLGTVFCLATVAALSTVAGIDPGIVWRDLFVEASQTGAGRFSYASLRAHVKYQFWTPHPVESQLLAGLVALLLLRLAWLLRQPTVRRQVLELLVPVSLMAASFVFVVTTANQHDNAWPYLFCFLGVLHAKSTLLLPTPWPNLGFRVLILLLAAGCVQYFAISNGERRFHDIVFEANAATQPRTEALRFMQLQTVPQLQRYTADDLDAVIDFLKSRSENFFLVGDSSFLYGVAGKPSVNPQLFFHSLMRPGVFTALRRRRYQEELFERFKRYNVGLIVLEGEQTWTEVDLAALTQLERFVRARTVRTHSFGSFKVLELRSTPTT